MPLAFLLSNWKLVGVVAGSVLLASWLGCERMKLIHEGAQQERQKIEEANHAAEQKADTGARTVDECYAAGGSWNRHRGVCEQPGPGK